VTAARLFAVLSAFIAGFLLALRGGPGATAVAGLWLVMGLMLVVAAAGIWLFVSPRPRPWRTRL
jgi:glycerol-3-phosphate acyltransferase PlsY